MSYSAQVIDHYENPRNVGSFPKGDNSIGTGMVGAPACGDVMKLQIKVEDGIITDAKFLRPMAVAQQLHSLRNGSRVRRWTRPQLLRILKSPNILHSPQLKYIAQFLLKTRSKLL